MCLLWWCVGVCTYIFVHLVHTCMFVLALCVLVCCLWVYMCTMHGCTCMFIPLSLVFKRYIPTARKVGLIIQVIIYNYNRAGCSGWVQSCIYSNNCSLRKNKCSSSGSLSRFKIHTEGDDGKEYAQYISLYQYTSIL